MRLLLLMVAGGFVLPSLALASYRVHRLKLFYYDDRGKIVKTGETVSTLDHLQYEHYHGGYRVLRAELLDTWYCPGDTSYRKPCARPKTGPTRGLASTEPKRQDLDYNRQPVRP